MPERKTGRPAFFGKAMKTNLSLRVTQREHELLQAAVDAGVDDAATQAGVIRNALAFYFSNHAKARAVARKVGAS